MSKPASKGALEDLHNKLVKKFDEIIDDIDAETKGGAAMLNVMRQMLKDNNIEAVVVPGTPLGNLAEKVAQFPFDPAEDTRPN